MLSRQFYLWTLSAIVFSSLPACATYFLRQDCQKTDWYEYGRNVAMSGNRLSGNTFVRRCEDANSNINYTALDQGFKKGMLDYCRPDTVRAIGKRGEFFAPDMCDGENIRYLQAQYREGVTEYCQRGNGINAGLTGKPYNQICPKDLEPDFLPEFNKGRKRYLVATAGRLNAEVDDTDRDIWNLESQKNSYLMQMVTLGNTQTVRHEVKYDEYTNTYREEDVVTDDPNIQTQKQDLNLRVQQADRDIAEKRKHQSELRKKAREMMAEADGL